MNINNSKYHKSILISSLLPNKIKHKYGPQLVLGYLSNNFPNDIQKIVLMFYLEW